MAIAELAGWLQPRLPEASPWWMPPDGSLHGPAVDHLMKINLALMGGLFVLAHVLLAIAFLRRRRRTGAGLPRVGIAEALPLALICITYAWMALTGQRLWAASRFQGPAPTAMHVEVTGVQFQWYFRYPGPDATFGRTKPQLVDAASGNPLGIDPTDPDGRDDLVSSVLVLPAGREVDLTLRAMDVIHGFFIPGMRLKQNAVPGMVLHVHFTPEKPGTYAILCSQLCGMGHARMQARLEVVTPVEFTAWLAKREARRLAAEQGGGE